MPNGSPLQAEKSLETRRGQEEGEGVLPGKLPCSCVCSLPRLQLSSGLPSPPAFRMFLDD